MTDSAIWLTCRDCGHTARVLAVMANRVLKTRTHCLQCLSTCEPCLNLTPMGQGITLSVEQGDALRDMDDKDVRTWLAFEGSRSDLRMAPLQWMLAAGCRLADRFGKRGLAQGAPFAAVHEAHRQAGTKAKHGNNGFHGTGTIGGTGSAAVRL